MFHEAIETPVLEGKQFFLLAFFSRFQLARHFIKIFFWERPAAGAANNRSAAATRRDRIEWSFIMGFLVFVHYLSQ